MNWSEMTQEWEQMKPLLQSRWQKLTEEDLGAVNGSRDGLALALQHRYGFSGGEAEAAICDFEKDVRRPGAVK